MITRHDRHVSLDIPYIHDDMLTPLTLPPRSSLPCLCVLLLLQAPSQTHHKSSEPFYLTRTQLFPPATDAEYILVLLRRSFDLARQLEDLENELDRLTQEEAQLGASALKALEAMG